MKMFLIAASMALALSPAIARDSLADDPVVGYGASHAIAVMGLLARQKPITRVLPATLYKDCMEREDLVPPEECAYSATHGGYFGHFTRQIIDGGYLLENSP